MLSHTHIYTLTYTKVFTKFVESAQYLLVPCFHELFKAPLYTPMHTHTHTKVFPYREYLHILLYPISSASLETPDWYSGHYTTITSSLSSLSSVWSSSTPPLHFTGYWGCTSCQHCVSSSPHFTDEDTEAQWAGETGYSWDCGPAQPSAFSPVPIHISQ